MSSVSSSDRRRQDDRVRKAREEYEAKESESQKAQRAEMERLNKRHYEALNRVSEDFGREMEELKDHYRATLSDRDQANIRKIEDVRNVYREQLKRKMEENESERRQMSNASSGALSKQKSISQSLLENLHEKHKSELKNRDEAFRELSQKNKQKLSDSLVSHDEKLKAAYDREIRGLVEERDSKLGSKERDEREIRKAHESQIKSEKRQRDAEVGRWKQKYVDTVNAFEENNNENMTTQSLVLKGEMGELNRKYNTALEKKYDQIEQSNEALHESVNNRLDSQVRSKQSKIGRLSDKLNHEMVNHERLRNIERRDLEDRHRTQLEIVERQKVGALEQMKEQTDKRIGQNLSKTQKTLRDTHRQHRSEAELSKLRNRQDREMLLQQHREALEQTTGAAEGRVKKVAKVARENQDAYSNYFENSLDQMRDNFSERIDDQRERNVDDMVRLNKNMGERFRGIEKTFEQRVETLTNKYEGKIGQMTDNHAKELKRLESYYGQRLENKEKEQKQQATSLEMKYEAKIAKLNEDHTEQLEKANRRHQEDMQNLAIRMNNYNKKA